MDEIPRAEDRDIDRVIAERVMGWKRSVSEQGFEHWTDQAGHIDPFNDGDRGNPFAPSIDIDNAWTVMERLRELGWRVFIGPAADNSAGWSVQIKPRTDNLHHHIMAPTAPLAICRAALYTLGAEAQAYLDGEDWAESHRGECDN